MPFAHKVYCPVWITFWDHVGAPAGKVIEFAIFQVQTGRLTVICRRKMLSPGQL
jgi:hypothetical protein